MRLRTIAGIVVALCIGVGIGIAGASTFTRPSSVVVQFGDGPSASNQIRVYITGAVKAPGVYPVHAGDRLVDAVEAAGGPAPDADTEAIDFAERLQDGQQYHVPRVGDPAQSTPAANTENQLVDINRADVNLLRSLPGLGATRAANIVTSRQKDGPFQRPEDLVARKLVTPSIFTQVKSLITTGP